MTVITDAMFPPVGQCSLCGREIWNGPYVSLSHEYFETEFDDETDKLNEALICSPCCVCLTRDEDLIAEMTQVVDIMKERIDRHSKSRLKVVAAHEGEKE
jgi:hypothetical protein